jgi:two-component system, sensor histidine kinase and response regulator
VNLKQLFHHRPVLLVVLACLIVHSSASAQYRRLDSLRNVVSQLPDDSTKVIRYVKVFVAALELNGDTALAIAHKQLALAEKTGFTRGKAVVYKEMCVAYQATGKLGKAIEYGLKSNAILESIGDMAGMTANYNNVGVIYQTQNKLPEALSYFTRSLAGFNRQKDTIAIYTVLTNIGSIHQKQGNASLALRYYEDALDIILKKRVHTGGQVGKAYYYLGSASFDLKKYSLAEQYLQSALKSIGNGPQTIVTSQIYPLLGKIYQVRNDLTKSLEMAKKGLSVMQSANYRPQKADNYLQVARAYANLGNYEEGYDYLNRYALLRDSLAGDQSVRSVEKLQYLHELERKELANVSLRKDREIRQGELRLKNTRLALQKAELERQKSVNLVVGIVLLATVTLAILIYVALRRRNKDNAILARQREEIMERNREISAQKDYLTKVDQAKNKLFSLVAHDLRTPVSNLHQALLLFNSDVLSKEDLDELSVELLDNVSSTSRMMDNVLHWAKGQLTGFKLKKTNLNLYEILQYNARYHRQQAEKKQVRLENRCTADLEVFADASSIDTVVRNLVSNAIKFCRPGDIIVLDATLTDGFVEVHIADSGLGMDEAMVRRLFNDSEHFTTPGTANEKGTGLGLLLCQEFVSANGGLIRVESEPGRGSTFYFTIPAAEPDREQVDAATYSGAMA